MTSFIAYISRNDNHMRVMGWAIMFSVIGALALSAVLP